MKRKEKTQLYFLFLAFRFALCRNIGIHSHSPADSNAGQSCSIPRLSAKSNFVFLNGFSHEAIEPVGWASEKEHKKGFSASFWLCQVPKKKPSCFRNGRSSFRCMHIYFLVIGVAMYNAPQTVCLCAVTVFFWWVFSFVGLPKKKILFLFHVWPLMNIVFDEFWLDFAKFTFHSNLKI